MGKIKEHKELCYFFLKYVKWGEINYDKFIHDICSKYVQAEDMILPIYWVLPSFDSDIHF